MKRLLPNVFSYGLHVLIIKNLSPLCIQDIVKLYTRNYLILRQPLRKSVSQSLLGYSSLVKQRTEEGDSLV